MVQQGSRFHVQSRTPTRTPLLLRNVLEYPVLLTKCLLEKSALLYFSITIVSFFVHRSHMKLPLPVRLKCNPPLFARHFLVFSLKTILPLFLNPDAPHIVQGLSSVFFALFFGLWLSCAYLPAVEIRISRLLCRSNRLSTLALPSFLPLAGLSVRVKDPTYPPITNSTPFFTPSLISGTNRFISSFFGHCPCL